jgi:hypothetical protein
MAEVILLRRWFVGGELGGPKGTASLGFFASARHDCFESV